VGVNSRVPGPDLLFRQRSPCCTSVGDIAKLYHRANCSRMTSLPTKAIIPLESGGLELVMASLGKKLHHYVPQFYLKAWDKDALTVEKAWVFCLQNSEIRRSKVRNVGAERLLRRRRGIAYTPPSEHPRGSSPTGLHVQTRPPIG
jgi:hypothetical protein